MNKAGGTGPTTPTLVGPKILSFMVKFSHFQSFGRTFGRTNKCQIEVFLKWSEQSCTPSAAPGERNFFPLTSSLLLENKEYKKENFQ